MDILKKANEVESKKYLLLTKRKTNSSIEESALKNEIIDLRNKIASGDAAERLALQTGSRRKGTAAQTRRDPVKCRCPYCPGARTPRDPDATSPRRAARNLSFH